MHAYLIKKNIYIYIYIYSHTRTHIRINIRRYIYPNEIRFLRPFVLTMMPVLTYLIIFMIDVYTKRRYTDGSCVRMYTFIFRKKYFKTFKDP
jgi:hypothetical protein